MPPNRLFDIFVRFSLTIRHALQEISSLVHTKWKKAQRDANTARWL